MNVAFPPRHGLSLFSGAGGLDLGVELAVPGCRTVCFVERDAYAAAVLVARMEDASLAAAPVWDDVCTFDGRPFRGVVDLVLGGFPCQDISDAGKRAGIEGARSGLWREFARIIGEVGPRFVFVENVAALASRGLDVVLGDLAALGFDAEWSVFRASDVGAGHERARIFVLAALAESSRDRAAGTTGDGGRTARAAEGALRGGGTAVGELRDAHDERDAVAHAERLARAGRREPGDVGSAPGAAAGERDQRQRGGDAAAYCGEDVALAERDGLERRERGKLAESDGRRHDAAPLGSGRGAVADSASKREREPHDAACAVAPQRARKDALGVRGELADSDVEGCGCERVGGLLDGERAPSEHDADGRGGSRRVPFPPGPGDTERWRAYLARFPGLEPALRRGADGMAYRLDRLRVLGNGVVPQQAALAWRVLWERLHA